MKFLRSYLSFIFCLLTLICVSQTQTTTQTTSVILSKTFTGQTNPISCIAYSPDGKYIASGSRSISLLSDSGEFEINIWSILDGKSNGHLVGHHNGIRSISFDKTGNRLVSADSKGGIRIWSIENMKEIKFIDSGDWINSICFTPDNKFILAEYSYAKMIKIWDSESGELITTIPTNIQIGKMDISPDGSKIALSCYKKIQIWSLISRKELVSVDDNSVNGFGIKYSNDGKKLAVGLGNGDIKVFDPENLTLKYTFQGHFKPVLSISFSKDNKYLISGSSDQMIKLWSLKTQKELKSLLNEHKGIVNSVVFSPVSNSFASAGEDKQIKVWNIK